MKEHSRTNGLKTTPLGTCQVGLVFLDPGRCIVYVGSSMSLSVYLRPHLMRLPGTQETQPA